MRAWILLLVGSFCVLALTTDVSPASAANLLVNGDFETGSLTPWAGVGGLGPNATVTVQSPDNGPSALGTHSAFLDTGRKRMG